MAKTAVPTYCPPAAEPQTFDMPAFHRWLIELRDARSKPSFAGRHTDKEHWAAALGRWRRHQHIVNPEVAVGRQRDTRNVRTELGEGRRGFTNQRCEHAGVAVRADGIASAQQQASAVDADTPVDLHVRSEIGDHPDLAGRVDAADNVPNHVREAAVRVGGTRHVRYRNITDGSLESHQRIIGYYRRSKGSSYEDHKNRCKQTLFHNFTFISFPLYQARHLRRAHSLTCDRRLCPVSCVIRCLRQLI